jgi:nitroimidazol reductase NimA-like FMN-containing flavoprotein (pyridoxamine 5'-phosphate oxidase superfamily)
MTEAPTTRTTVKRLPDRGRYDRETVAAILDSSLICHLGFVADGQPVVIPTIQARRGDTVYVHGSPASRMLRTMKQGLDVCLTVTLVDGLVVGRSAFHHSLNYRSVVVFGRARLVDDVDEKLAALAAITEHVLPGRWDEARRPNDKELRATHVLALSIAEASAKVRTGPPLDEPEDYELPIWAGVVPLATVAGAPIADPQLSAGIPVPPSVLTAVE